MNTQQKHEENQAEIRWYAKKIEFQYEQVLKEVKHLGVMAKEVINHPLSEDIKRKLQTPKMEKLLDELHESINQIL